MNRYFQKTLFPSLFPAAHPQKQHEDIRVLVADTNTHYARSVAAVFKTVFRRVTLAENGPEILSKCAHESFDLIVLDNRLPGMLGIEVARRLEQYYPEMRRILTSEDDTDPVIDSALEYGMIHRFLKKPFSVYALLSEAEFLLGIGPEPLQFDDEDLEEETEEHLMDAFFEQQSFAFAALRK